MSHPTSAKPFRQDGPCLMLTLHSSPGKDKDDEIMYGAPSKEPASTLESTQAVPSSTLETKPEAEQKDKGVLRQILYVYFTPGSAATITPILMFNSNPGGDKYSEQSYGTTATTQSGMADQLQKQPASQEPLKGTNYTPLYEGNRVIVVDLLEDKCRHSVLP